MENRLKKLFDFQKFEGNASLQSVIDDILTGRYGYEMTVSYNERSMSFGEGRGEPTSECSRTYEVLGGDSVQVRLVIY